jgi:hypothetical protein
MRWLGDHWRDILDVLGVLATVTAAALAWLALVGIKRERRIDFELGLLVQLGDAQQGTYSHPSPEIRLRLRLLRRPGPLPTADEWCAEDYRKAAAWDRYVQVGQPQGLSCEQWVKERVVDEIDGATETVLGER